jgi:CheY-like chemotaxis protein
MVTATPVHFHLPEAVKMPDRSALRIVIADDNRDAAVALSMLLDRLGFRVVGVAYDGESALEFLREQEPNVALLDIALPELDGYEIARLAREELPRPPRLIAVTGLGDACDRTDALEAGFDAHFVKPVKSTDLERLLLAYLSEGEP